MTRRRIQGSGAKLLPRRPGRRTLVVPDEDPAAQEGARRTVEEGAGVTRRLVEVQTVSFSSPEHLEELSAVSTGTFDDNIRPIEETLLAWRDDPSTRPQLEEGDDGTHSAEWFAWKCLYLIREIRRDIAAGKAGRAAGNAMELGRWLGQIDVKQVYERPALSGERKAKDLGDARGRWNRQRSSTAAEKRRRWQQLANEHWQHRPGLSVTSVAEHIKRETDAPEAVRTIRDAIKKPGSAG